MQMLSELQTRKAPRHRVRELVCAYRPLRDSDGRVVDVPTVLLKDPRTAAVVLAPLIADQTVEVCDGLPEYVEDGTVTSDYYCPWSAKIVSID